MITKIKVSNHQTTRGETSWSCGAADERGMKQKRERRRRESRETESRGRGESQREYIVYYKLAGISLTLEDAV